MFNNKFCILLRMPVVVPSGVSIIVICTPLQIVHCNMYPVVCTCKKLIESNVIVITVMVKMIVMNLIKTVECKSHVLL